MHLCKWEENFSSTNCCVALQHSPEHLAVLKITFVSQPAAGNYHISKGWYLLVTFTYLLSRNICTLAPLLAFVVPPRSSLVSMAAAISSNKGHKSQIWNFVLSGIYKVKEKTDFYERHRLLPKRKSPVLVFHSHCCHGLWVLLWFCRITSLIGLVSYPAFLFYFLHLLPGLFHSWCYFTSRLLFTNDDTFLVFLFDIILGLFHCFVSDLWDS